MPPSRFVIAACVTAVIAVPAIALVWAAPDDDIDAAPEQSTMWVDEEAAEDESADVTVQDAGDGASEADGEIDSYASDIDIDDYSWEANDSGIEALDAEMSDGVVDVSSGEFVSDDDSLAATFAQWGTPEEAEAYVDALRSDELGIGPLVDGDIDSGAGHFWYYARNDGDQEIGVVYWYSGTITGKLSGDPREVQQFFLRFPK